MNELVDVLKKDFDRKIGRHPNFSLRSYARWLQLNPTSLSLFMNGKRGLSTKARAKIIEKLELLPEESETLLQCPKTAKTFEDLDIDTLHVVSDWYYFAILSLMEIKDFDEDPKWVSARLNITELQAKTALKRLEKLSLIRRDENGLLRATGVSFKTTDQIANIGVRRQHYQALDLARESLDTDSLTDRDFSAMTMAIDPTRLPIAKQRIKQFRRRLCNYLEGGDKKEVYRICISLFPLTRKVPREAD